MTKAAARSSSGLLTVCGFLAMAFGLTHCGGSSGTPRDAAGSGGSTGAGGTSVTGSGGSGGSGSGGSGGGVGGSSGGATGSGGAGGTNPSLSCTPGVSPAMPIITDFSPTSWSTTTGKWGVVGNLTGAPFAYKGPMAGTAMASSVATEIMTLTGTVAAGDYAGGGLSFDQCVNTTTYTGVQFTLGGSTGGCDVLLQVQTYSQQGVSNRGGCATGASCYHFPQLKVQVGSPVTVHFTDVANTGMPVAAADIAREIVGLQFQLQVPPGAPDGGTQSPCNGVAVTVDDVRFVSN